MEPTLHCCRTVQPIGTATQPQNEWALSKLLQQLTVCNVGGQTANGESHRFTVTVC